MRTLTLSLLTLALIPAASAAERPTLTANGGGQCAPERYYAPDDDAGTQPLARPHAVLAATLKAARGGDAREQRNLAVSYASGYLTSPCPERAAYWYGRAADGGDDRAKAWIARQVPFARLAAGPECVEASCGLSGEGMGQTLSLVADPKGHFQAKLTINGVTVDGIIDTGATLVSLGSDIAARMGISPEGGTKGLAAIANGAVIPVYKKMVPQLKVGTITLTNVECSIGNAGAPTLIGMSFLRRVKMNAVGGTMILTQ